MRSWKDMGASVLVIDMKSWKLMKLVIPYNEEVEDSCYEDEEDNTGMWSMNIFINEPLLCLFSMYTWKS